MASSSDLKATSGPAHFDSAYHSTLDSSSARDSKYAAQGSATKSLTLPSSPIATVAPPSKSLQLHSATSNTNWEYYPKTAVGQQHLDDMCAEVASAAKVPDYFPITPLKATAERVREEVENDIADEWLLYEHKVKQDTVGKKKVMHGVVVDRLGRTRAAKRASLGVAATVDESEERGSA